MLVIGCGFLVVMGEEARTLYMQDTCSAPSGDAPAMGMFLFSNLLVYFMSLRQD